MILGIGFAFFTVKGGSINGGGSPALTNRQQTDQRRQEIFHGLTSDRAAISPKESRLPERVEIAGSRCQLAKNRRDQKRQRRRHTR